MATPISMSVSPSPPVRAGGSSSNSRLSLPMTTVKSPLASTSRPPRSIVSRADHIASTSDEPGAHDGTVNDEEPPLNSPPATGSSTLVTPTQSSVFSSLPASVPTSPIMNHESFICTAAESARPAQRYR
jgi:hypothetical protein